MRVIAKSSFFKDGKIYKKGDKLEIETAAFKPHLMTEIPELKIEKKEAGEKPVRKRKR